MPSLQSSPTDATQVAEDTFVFAYPLVAAGQAINRFTVNRLTVSRERPDALRISGWLDVREPLVLATPDTCGRYFALWLRNAWNAVFANIGARTTGTAARAFALLPPEWPAVELPPGLTPIRAPTRIVQVRGSVEAVGDAGDAGFAVVSLNQWPGVAEPPVAGPPLVPEAVAEIDTHAFFDAFWRLAEDNPPTRADRETFARLRAHLPTPERALEAGVRRGRAMVQAELARPPGEVIDDWRINYGTGRRAADHLQRAAAIHAPSAADPAADELVAIRDADEGGAPLDGSRRYVLRFAPDRAPPIDGFWTLTAFDPARDSYGERSVSDLHGPRADADGSIAILVQHEPPARKLHSNWLPAPLGDFRVELRLYWPRAEALDGRWVPPPLARLPFMRSG